MPMTDLKQDHSETNALNSVQNTEPQPQAKTEVRSCVAGPWNVQRKGRRPPEHLEC
jgi:hypothetical protein